MIFDKLCRECGNPIPINKRSDSVCCSRKCIDDYKNKRVSDWKKANPERRKELEKQSYERNKEKRLTRSKERYYETLDYQKERKKKSNRELKKRVFDHYGQGKAECHCCGESILEGLTLDHINQDGAEHRRQEMKKGKGTGFKMWRWAIKNQFPPIFRVACWTCNSMAYYNNGICPHGNQH